MNSAIKVVLSAGVVAALSWSPASAVQAPAIAATPSTASSGFGTFDSVSCPSVGNCAAAGTFGPGYKYQAIVGSETNGSWGRAKQVAGLSSLPGAPPFSSELMAVSCGAAGNCGAGGYYWDDGAHQHPLVVDEKNGVWGNAHTIDMSQLRGGTPVELSQISFMSCPAPGDCTAAGSYTTPHRELVFIATEQDGTWGPAENLAGSAYVSFTGFTGIKALSCVSPGNCSVGGDYDAFVNNTTFHQAFVATETNGTWRRLREVPGTNVLNAQFAATNSMSCTAGGTCTAVGSYESLNSGNTIEHPFITSRAHGTWGPVQTVPGLATLPTGGAASARLDFVWCASAAYCTAVGDYVDRHGTAQWFGVTERNGTWGSAVKLRTGARPVFIFTLSCTSISSCSAGGDLQFAPAYRFGALVISKTNGVWGNAEQVPGLSKINHDGQAKLNSVSCSAPGYCVGGGFTSPTAQSYPFITTQTAGTWGSGVIPGTP